MSWSDAITWLESTRTPAGAWPYLRDQPPAAEPTLLALAAGALAPLDWLEQAELSWATLMLPAMLSRLPDAGALTERATDRILSLHGEAVSETAGTFSPSLIGWSWVPGTFSWVEPTAWAVLSLRAAGQGDHPRTREGIALLEDRQCADGGWNAGNPDMLGTDLPGYLYLTGWVLCALPPGPSADRGVAFLAGVRDRPSTRNLALALLAHLAHGADTASLTERLRARQQPDGSFGPRIDRTALAACALRAAETGVHPFGLPHA